MNHDTTPTPRTDAIQYQGNPVSPTIENKMLRSCSRQLERELTEKTNEVARLRELLNKVEQSANHWEAEALRYCRNSDYWRDRAVKAEAALAPAPEEPVMQDSRITEPVTKRLCKDCGQPHSKHTLHPYETICPEPVSEGTRRPLPTTNHKQISSKLVDDTKQSEPCPHHCIVPLEQGDMIVHQCTRCGKKLKKYPKQEEKAPDDLHAWMRLQEDINREVAVDLQRLFDEIAKLKEATPPANR